MNNINLIRNSKALKALLVMQRKNSTNLFLDGLYERKVDQFEKFPYKNIEKCPYGKHEYWSNT